MSILQPFHPMITGGHSSPLSNRSWPRLEGTLLSVCKICVKDAGWMPFLEERCTAKSKSRYEVTPRACLLFLLCERRCDIGVMF